MSDFTKQLLNRAEELKAATPEVYAVELMKQAGMEDEEARLAIVQEQFEKSAASELASYSGVDIEHAVTLVKAAGKSVKDMPGFVLPKFDFDPTAELLTKAAEYIEKLEARVGEVEEMQKQAAFEAIKLPEPFEKAAMSGNLTFEDLAELKKMDQELLTKVASMTSVSDEPWGMGHPAGVARPKTDPMLEWLLN